jgi:DNA-directed RNA polymerase specialized sigma24 family protein
MRDAPDSFATFVDEHFDPVFRCLAVGTRDRHLARVATEQTFARALVRWTRSGEPTAASLYVSASRDALRRRHRVDDPPVARADDETLERAIEDLPEVERLALVLHHAAGLSPDDLGRALRCSRQAAQATLREAYRRVGVERDDDDDIPEVELDAP